MAIGGNFFPGGCNEECVKKAILSWTNPIYVIDYVRVYQRMPTPKNYTDGCRYNNDCNSCTSNWNCIWCNKVF
jgi:hypothetical protein